MTQEEKDILTEEILSLVASALNEVMTPKQGWKFLDIVNPLLKDTPFAYMIFGDCGLKTILKSQAYAFGKVMWQAEKVHGSSIGWDESTFKDNGAV